MVAQNTIFVFIPDTLEKANVGFLYGFVINKEYQSEFYITRDKLSIDPTNCIGYCGMSMNISKINWIHINYYEETLKVNEISCQNNQDFHLIFVVYDYFSFRNSEILHSTCKTYGEHFTNLSKALKYDNEKPNISYGFEKKLITYCVFKSVYLLLLIINSLLLVLKCLSPLQNMSCTVALTLSTITSIQWSLRSIIKERKINLKVGNTITSKIADVLLGLMIIFIVSNFHIDLILIFNSSAKELITNLQELLKFLMGSPVGLKLNHAFNNALGNFFLYHIALWRTFLIVTNPVLNTAVTFVFALSTLGFSFQAALTADIFTLATFHVYCIYVYAARLYGVQMSGLLSLWKLFIGRKYNPLRNRVDSCQYSHHQLFVGTLAFTILLFLLPTTMLYYFVFTTLRLMLFLFDKFLRWLRQTVLSLPLYVTILWAINSPKTKGSVYVEITEQKKDSGALTLRATLKTDPWRRCISQTKPPVNETTKTNNISFSSLLKSITVGDLL